MDSDKDNNKAEGDLETCRMDLREEFSQLHGTCYLDHAGATLYSTSQMRELLKDFSTTLYGNPHSLSIASRLTSDVVDQIRYRILQHFNTSMNEYDVVFTSGATAAFKLVAESFNFGKDSPGVFAYAQENHTSVLGMREEIASRCSSVFSLTLEQLENEFSDDHHMPDLNKTTNGSNDTNSLFVFSGQCNFSGRKCPLSWTTMCHNGYLLRKETEGKSRWFCMLDAAALAATNPLDLSIHQPDFVAISFYKMFGYPSGLGALLVKSSVSHFLSAKKYFGGGTVLMALSSASEHKLKPVLHERLEDGTLPFLSIVSLRHGFNTLTRLAGSMATIQKHTFTLARRAHHSLKSLRHSNGAPVAKLYCDTDFEDSDTQGATVNFNLLNADGKYVGFAKVLNMANSFNIHLRTGCFCNPGACQRHLNLTVDELRAHFQSGHVCGDNKDLIDGVPTGSIRISFGYMSSEADVDTFLSMVYSCFVDNSFYSSSFISVAKDEQWFDAVDKRDTFSSCRVTSAEVEFGSAKLQELILYPVKSCGGFRPSTPWVIGPRGLAYDRTWMVMTPSGSALTQSQEPRLACLLPVIDLENRKLLLSFAGGCQPKQIVVPLDEADRALCLSKVCGDRVVGQDCGDEAAAWLSEELGRHGLRLMRQLDGDARSRLGAQKALSLSNSAQFLLISETSVSWLGNQIEPGECDKDGLIDRFRANLVVGGLTAPFSEMNWEEVQIGDQFFVDTVAFRLRETFPLLINPKLCHFFYFVHRLDYSCSGALCIALNKTACAAASRAFVNQKAVKYYLALVRGHVKEELHDISVAIGKDNREQGTGTSNKMCIKGPHCSEPRESHTRALVLNRGFYNGDPATKLLLRLYTGRRHQLRVHCSFIGHTIIGDYTYSNRTDLLPPRMYLHSYRLMIPNEVECLKIQTPDPFTEDQLCGAWIVNENVHSLNESSYALIETWTKEIKSENL